MAVVAPMLLICDKLFFRAIRASCRSNALTSTSFSSSFLISGVLLTVAFFSHMFNSESSCFILLAWSTCDPFFRVVWPVSAIVGYQMFFDFLGKKFGCFFCSPVVSVKINVVQGLLWLLVSWRFVQKFIPQETVSQLFWFYCHYHGCCDSNRKIFCSVCSISPIKRS